MSAPGTLPRVTWDGLDLNLLSGDEDRIVTNVTGWYDTPDSETHDVARTLTDGAIYGPRVIEARTITIEGYVIGERARLVETRNQLATRAWAREPSQLIIGDPWLATDLASDVRADPGMEHEWHGSTAYRYQVTVVAADPRRYSTSWSMATIRLSGGGDTGRRYPRSYPWHYAGTEVAGTARLQNLGGLPAPVWAVYVGPLSESWLTDGSGAQLHIAALGAGEQILIDTQSLVALAPGGATRASYVLAGSSPLLVPPRSTVTWSMRGSGAGNVLLNWRGTYA